MLTDDPNLLHGPVHAVVEIWEHLETGEEAEQTLSEERPVIKNNNFLYPKFISFFGPNKLKNLVIFYYGKFT